MTVRPAWMRYALWVLIAVSIIAFGPILLALGAGAIADWNGCTLNEGSVHPCVVLGTDMGGLLYGMGVMGWLFLLTLPLTLVAVAGWIAFAVVALLRAIRGNAAP